MYFTWNYDNHKIALRILWISLLSNRCILLFGHTSVSVLSFGKNCLMFRSHLYYFLSPFSKRSSHFLHHKKERMPRSLSLFCKTKPTNSDWLLILARHIPQSSRPYIKWDNIMSQWKLWSGVITWIQTSWPKLWTKCLIIISSVYFNVTIRVQIPQRLCVSCSGTRHVGNSSGEYWSNFLFVRFTCICEVYLHFCLC